MIEGDVPTVHSFYLQSTTHRRIISKTRYMVVRRYQKQNIFVKSPKQNWNNSFYTYS